MLEPRVCHSGPSAERVREMHVIIGPPLHMCQWVDNKAKSYAQVGLSQSVPVSVQHI